MSDKTYQDKVNDIIDAKIDVVGRSIDALDSIAQNMLEQSEHRIKACDVLLKNLIPQKQLRSVDLKTPEGFSIVIEDYSEKKPE